MSVIDPDCCTACAQESKLESSILLAEELKAHEERVAQTKKQAAVRDQIIKDWLQDEIRRLKDEIRKPMAKMAYDGAYSIAEPIDPADFVPSDDSYPPDLDEHVFVHRRYPTDAEG